MAANTSNLLASSSTISSANLALERRSQASIQRRPRLFRLSGWCRELTFSSDEKEIASVYAASEHDVDTAVKAARAAFKDPSWRDISSTDRGNLMLELASLVEKNAEILATIETWDNGKPYTVALTEDVAEVAGTLRYYGGYADKIHGQVINTSP